MQVRRLEIGAIVATLMLGALVLASCGGQPASTPAVPPEPVAASEVLDKQPHTPVGDDLAWAAWSQTSTGLEELWTAFQLEDTPPRLSEGEAILLAGTGESGSCPMTITQVDAGAGVVDLSVREYPDTPDEATFETTSGELLPECEADFNPVTFVIAVEASVATPPLEVTLGETSIVVDGPDMVAQVPFQASRGSN